MYVCVMYMHGCMCVYVHTYVYVYSVMGQQTKASLPKPWRKPEVHCGPDHGEWLSKAGLLRTMRWSVAFCNHGASIKYCGRNITHLLANVLCMGHGGRRCSLDIAPCLQDTKVVETFAPMKLELQGHKQIEVEHLFS